MSKIYSACEFSLCVSINDFVEWADENDDDSLSNQFLDAMLQFLGLEVTAKKLHDRYFNAASVGAGDVYVFTSKSEFQNLFVIDMLREPTDQQDLVAIYVRCSEGCVVQVATFLRCFFDVASTQIAFEQASVSTRLHRILEVNTYPLSVIGSIYLQYLQQCGDKL